MTVSSPLTATGVAVKVGGRELLTNFNLQLASGELVAILGRNGCGKTLTLHTLAGLRPADGGTVAVTGTPLDQLGKRDIAQRVGLLTQDMEEGFVTTVREMVLIGRHPHLKFWQWESADDEELAARALQAVDLAGFEPRLTNSLSGGELRRVAIAGLLVQAPAVYLLDEPTNHLDPHHQMAILQLFRKLADAGSTVVATLHDPTLAARFADRVVLLQGDGGAWEAGPTSGILGAEKLSALYQTQMLEVRQDGRRIFIAT